MQLKQTKLVTGLLAGFLFAGTVFPAAVFANTHEQNAAVKRLAGDDRYETAVKVAEYGFPNGAETIVLAPGMDANLVDALTAAPLAKANNAPILLTQGNKLTDATKEALKALNEKKEIKNVIVVSNAIKEDVTDAIKEEFKDNEELTVENLGGDDRFATAANIAAKVEDVTGVMFAYGFSNADALSVASIAAAKGMPILLTDKNSGIPKAEADYLESIKEELEASYIIGGTAVIADSIKEAIPGDDEIRIAGNDRFATNLEVLKAFTDVKYDTVYVANGTNNHLVDALVASVLAANTGSPIVLAQKQLSAEAYNFLMGKMALESKVVALGGEGLVAPEVLDVNYVRAQDFGVMQFSGVNGYSVGFALTGALDPMTEIEKIEVSLFKGDKVLATNESTNMLFGLGVNQLSTPFNIDGDFAGDSYWKYGEFDGNVLDVPTKAVIKVTSKDGNVYTAVNTNLTGGTDLLLDDSKTHLQGQEFGVWQGSGVNGYSVGLKFVDGTTAGNYDSITVTLLDEEGKVLATNTSTQKLLREFANSNVLSTPFNIDGDFTADGYWNYGEYDGTTADIPAKAQIIAERNDGKTWAAQITELTGNTALLGAPEITSDLNEEVTVAVVNDFNVALAANKEAGETVKVKIVLTEGNSENVALQYEEGGEYKDLTLTDNKAYYGPEAGYPLSDATSAFKVTFNEVGTYTYTLQIVNVPAEGENEVVLSEASYTVEVAEAVVEEDAGDDQANND